MPAAARNIIIIHLFNVKEKSYFIPDNPIVKPWLSKTATILLLLSQILDIYGSAPFLFGFSACMFLAVIYVVQSLLKKNEHYGKSVPKMLMVLMVYRMFIHIVSANDLGEALPLAPMLHLLIFIMFFDVIDFNYLLKSYRTIAKICIAFFVIQEFLFITTGARILGILNFLPRQYITDDLLSHNINFGRSSSFFSEPAHFAQFILPLLCIELFHNKGKIKNAVLIMLFLFFLKSGNGLITLIVILSYWALTTIFNFSNLRNKIVLFVFAFCCIGFLSYMSGTEQMEYITGRGDEVSNFSDPESASYIRFWQGYVIFGDYSITEMIFGADSDSTIDRHTANVLGFVPEIRYFNNIQELLIRTGFIGLFIFLLFNASLWRNNNQCGRSCILAILTLSLMASLFFTRTLCLYYVIAYLCQKEYKKQIYLNRL